MQVKKEQKNDNPKSRIMTVQERVKGKKEYKRKQAKKEQKNAKPRKSKRLPNQERVEECQAKKE